MFFPSIRGSVYKLCSSQSQIASMLPKVNLLQPAKIAQPRCFHMLAPILTNTRANTFLTQQNTPKMLAAPSLPQLIQTCGMKSKDSVRRRCQDCYLVVRQGILYNMCKTHPRHKQMKKHLKAKFTWMLSHASQSKVRPW